MPAPTPQQSPLSKLRLLRAGTQLSQRTSPKLKRPDVTALAIKKRLAR